MSSVYPRSGRRGNKFRRETQIWLSSDTLGSSNRIPRHYIILLVSSGSSPGPPPLWMCPKRARQRDATKRHPNHMPKPSNKLLSMQRCQAPHPIVKAKLPVNIQRKPISATCVRKLILYPDLHSHFVHGQDGGLDQREILVQSVGFLS